MILRKVFIVAYLLTCCNITAGQDTIKIIRAAGEEYEAGTLHRIFFGELWRDTWVTPVDVTVLDLNNFAGGLTPLKKGGGLQTKSLRLRGNNGKEYKFRSLDKDPRKVLPPELQETFVAGVLKDQISTSNPYASLVTAPILNELGILQAEPQLVIMPDSEILGEFRSEFGNLMGTIEEHPEEGFANSVKVKGTFELFDEMEEDNDNSVDAVEYLKVRLADIFIGDWDRHTDQWRWARYDYGKKRIWRPIPRDRDQAFARFDGLFPWMSSMAITQLEGFSGTYPEIEDLTWSGRYIDRRLLSSLTKAEWDSVTIFVVSKLTDSLLINAVNRLPRNVFAVEGDRLTFTLIQRRNRLIEASGEFYNQTFKYIEIRGSDKREYAEIVRGSDEIVSVNLYKKNKETGAPEGEPLYSRKFNSEETKEIRLFLLGGDDYAVVKGIVNSSIDVIINGGTGDNIIIDSSKVKGYFLGLVPFIPESETKTHIYTVNKKTEIITGPSSEIIRIKDREPKDYIEKYEPKVQDYGHDWRFSPWFEINSDVGIFIGGGPILYEFGYLADPYVYMMELKAGYANKGSKFKFAYTGDFYSVIKDARLRINVLASGLEVRNFYGIGNETVEAHPQKEQEYYRVDQKQYVFNPSVEYKLIKNLAYNLGLELIFTDTDPRVNSFLHEYQPYGVNNFSMIGLITGLTLLNTDHPVIPSEGYFANITAFLYPGLNEENSTFGKAAFDVRYYYPITFINSVAALKSNGETIWGNYPFFKAAFLGDVDNLKGYVRDRFAGDASLAFNSEIRTSIADLNIIFPMHIGTVISAETGRVFVKGQVSNVWHPSYGGGIWLSVINKDLTFSLTAADSKENLMFYLEFGFAY